MPSESRLHPLSVLFVVAKQAKTLVLPGLFVFFTARSSAWGWEKWAMLFIVPTTIAAIVRYASFRYRYDATEMVIRKGFVFKSERHVPYARIQKVDAVQNVFHRMLGVAEVRVETGGGTEPEAILRVLPVAAYEEMRRRVYGESGRGARTKIGAAQAAAGGAQATPAGAQIAPAGAQVAGDEAQAAADGTRAAIAGLPAPAGATPRTDEGEPSHIRLGQDPGRVLLTLPLRDLLLHGIIENRGTVIVGAVFGLTWELGLMGRVTAGIFGTNVSAGGITRDMFRAVFGQGRLPLGKIAYALAALVAFLVVIRILSMVWATVRLHGFTLALSGGELKTSYGLFTRVLATIPLRRIQTVTVREGPLHRLFGRASMRVDTAGGTGEGENETQREWLAPLIRRDAVLPLLREVVPDAALDDPDWKPAAPGAFRRELKGSLIVTAFVCGGLAIVLRLWVLVLVPLLVLWAVIHSRLAVRHMAHAVTEGAVVFQSGWLWRQMTVARFAKIQVVALHASPFDRRARMANVHVDTAGAGNASHRVQIPYLERAQAESLLGLLSAKAAGTAFRW